MKIKKIPVGCLMAVLTYASACQDASGQTATWNAATGGEWTETAKWSWSGTLPATALPDAATSIVLSNGGTVRLKNSEQSIFGLTMNNGRLEVSKDTSAGVLTVGGAIIFGSGAGSTSVVTLDGLGTELNKTGITQVHIGSAGTATLNITNQAKMTSSGTIHLGLGSATGATGTGILNVNTLGQLITTTTFILGYRGNGTMNIESGGYVKSPNGFIAGYGQDANRVQGTAAVKISGTGSKWETGGLYVGHTGTGSLLVEDSGMLASTSTTSIGFYNAGIPTGSTNPAAPTKYGSGTVTVQTGGQWVSTGAVAVGTVGGKGTLNIASQGRINVGGGTGVITLGEDGVMNIGGDPLLDVAPRAPGLVFAGSITSSAFTGRTLNLYHSDMSGDYHLTKTGLAGGEHVALTGTLQLNVLSGTTTLSGSNSLTGDVTIGGLSDTPAKLIAKNAQSLGTGQIVVKDNGSLEVAPSLSGLTLGNLRLEGGSSLTFKANPSGGEWANRIYLNGWLEYAGDPGEKITINLTGVSAIQNPELYDWTFLRSAGGIAGDMTGLFEVVSDIPGFYVFQREDTLVLGMSVVPEPGRILLCLGGLSGLALRRRR